jgi:chromosome partitioning protein
LAARERALGGVEVVEDSSVDAWRTARKIAGTGRQVVIDTAGFRSEATLACIAAADFLLVPVKASPLDIDRMLDTLNSLIEASGARRPLYRCLLTQTTRDSVIAKHIRAELTEAGFPVLNTEMNNRVIYAEAALWGATPTLIEPSGAAAREIAAIAAEIDDLTGLQAAA